jgi:hypothetical protein
MFDGSQLVEQERALQAAEAELSEITKRLPAANKVKTFSKRMEAALLAKYAAPFLRAGKQPSVANSLAMCDEKYLKELEDLKDVFEIAEKVVKDHAGALTRWETARSLLSSAKACIQPSFSQGRRTP